MLNTLGWSVSSIAFADLVASEQLSGQLDDAQSKVPDPTSPEKSGKHCNEGCHIFTHMQGLVQTAVVYPLAFDSFGISRPVEPPSDLSPDSLFRPPRFSALA